MAALIIKGALAVILIGFAIFEAVTTCVMTAAEIRSWKERESKRKMTQEKEG